MLTNIELLDKQRKAIEAELATSPDEAMGGILDKLDTVMDRLSFERPKTARDIAILLDVALYWLDLAINTGREEQDKVARQAHSAKVERILSSIRRARSSSTSGMGA